MLAKTPPAFRARPLRSRPRSPSRRGIRGRYVARPFEHPAVRATNSSEADRRCTTIHNRGPPSRSFRFRWPRRSVAVPIANGIAGRHAGPGRPLVRERPTCRPETDACGPAHRGPGARASPSRSRSESGEYARTGPSSSTSNALKTGRGGRPATRRGGRSIRHRPARQRSVDRFT